MIRVMTFNLRCGHAEDGPNNWEHRRDLVVETIRDADPDVLAVQECIPIQDQWIRDAFPAFDGHGTPRGGPRAGAEMCALYWRRSRFTVESTGTFWLSETPDVPGSVGWDAVFARIVTRATLRDAETGREVQIASAHLEHQGPLARVEAARLIRERLQGRDLVLAGDFNASPDGEVYDILTRAHDNAPGLTDAHRATGRTEDAAGTFHGFDGGSDGERIDWVMLGAGVKAVDCRTNRGSPGGRFPSDHHPVIVEVELGLAGGGGSFSRSIAINQSSLGPARGRA